MNKAITLGKFRFTQGIANSYSQVSGSLTDKMKSLGSSSNLRKIKAQDNNEVRSFIQNILLKKGGVGFDELYYDKELSDISESYKLGKSNFFVLTKKSEVVGTIGISPSSREGNVSELKKIYSHENNAGQLRQLIRRAIEWSIKVKYTKCEVYENKRNTEVIDALLDFGFKSEVQAGNFSLLTLRLDEDF